MSSKDEIAYKAMEWFHARQMYLKSDINTLSIKKIVYDAVRNELEALIKKYLAGLANE